MRPEKTALAFRASSYSHPVSVFQLRPDAEERLQNRLAWGLTRIDRSDAKLVRTVTKAITAVSPILDDYARAYWASDDLSASLYQAYGRELQEWANSRVKGQEGLSAAEFAEKKRRGEVKIDPAEVMEALFMNIEDFLRILVEKADLKDKTKISRDIQALEKARIAQEAAKAKAEVVFKSAFEEAGYKFEKLYDRNGDLIDKTQDEKEIDQARKKGAALKNGNAVFPFTNLHMGLFNPWAENMRSINK